MNFPACSLEGYPPVCARDLFPLSRARTARTCPSPWSSGTQRERERERERERNSKIRAQGLGQKHRAPYINCTGCLHRPALESALPAADPNCGQEWSIWVFLVLPSHFFFPDPV